MRKFETKGITEILNTVMREEGLAIPLMEYRAAQAWTTVMGKAIADYTTDVKVKNGILYAKVNSAPLRQNLQMMHNNIAQKINQHLGAQVLTDVKLL